MRQIHFLLAVIRTSEDVSSAAICAEEPSTCLGICRAAVIQPIRHPDPIIRRWGSGRTSALKLPVVCGDFRGGRNQILLAGVEQQLALRRRVSRVGLLIIDVGLRLAVEELAVEIEPRRHVGCEQSFTISARTVNSVGREQAG